MRKLVLEFCRRGLVACGFGPLVLVGCYLILQRQCAVQTLTVNEVCVGILSLSALAFLAGGMNAIYQVERIPLAAAIFIHGSVLYLGYLVTYLLNGWLELGYKPVLAFTAIFVLGFLAIWGIIYISTRRKTARLNEMLKQKQRMER